MVEQATFLLQKLEFENMVMSMLIINPGICEGEQAQLAQEC